MAGGFDWKGMATGPKSPGGTRVGPPQSPGGVRVPPPSGNFEDYLTGGQRDAYLALKALFDSYGLGSLAGKIYEYIKAGQSSDTIALELQDTKEYKQRFAANEERRKKGLAVLSPAEYLSLESAYRQYLSSAGLPMGFYDSTSDFTNWIASDVSPTEIKSRVDLAVAATAQANSSFKQALKEMYGLSDADLTAYFLDQKKALPILQSQTNAAYIGAAALQRGFQISQYAKEFANEGVTSDQAQRGYAYIADTYQTLKDIAARNGEDWTQTEAERDVFEPGHTNVFGEDVTAKKRRLASTERALFSGAQGSSVGGLGQGFQQT